MTKAITLPKLARRRSRVHGFGVFAAEPIAKNTRIVTYDGELVRNRDCEEREERYLAEGCIWIFRVNRIWSRDAAVGGNIAPLHQPRVPAQLLVRSGGQDDLDPRLTRDSHR